MTDRIATVVVGRHDWPEPPSKNTVDLPVLRALQQRLGGDMLVIAGTTGHRQSAWRDGPLRIVLLPIVSRTAFLRDAARLSATALADREDRAVFVASDVWGGLVGAWMRRRHGVPFLMQVQGDVLEPGPEYGSVAKRRALADAARIGVTNATVVRCLNSAIEQQVKHVAPHARTRIVGSRVDTTLFAYRGTKRIDEPIAPKLCTVGTLSERKNQALLIEMLAGCDSALPRATLAIAGQGDAEARLRGRSVELGVSSRVTFMGQVPNHTLPALLASMDLFVFPSRSEGQPRAVLEALSVGLPVMASDIPAHTDVVVDDVTGRLISADNPRLWATTLVSLVNDPDRLTRFARTGRALVEGRHSFEPLLDSFAEIVRMTASVG